MVAVGAAPGFLTTVLSTIAPPLPLGIVVVYSERDFDCYVCSWRTPVSAEHRPRVKSALNHRERFKVLNEMYTVREFQLVLCADVLDCITEYAVQVLERIVESEWMGGGLGYLQSKPLVISEIRSPRTRPGDEHVGRKGRDPIHASAL